MIAKRILDIALALPVLVLLGPVLVAVALWIRVDSPGPAIFRQVRVGRDGEHFIIYKFRTMVADAEGRGKRVTAAGDARITRAGRVLRAYKLDELPQLVNVVKGEMSLVGPRPEVPEYVAHYPESIREKVLSVPPGITDRASIEFRNENEVLAAADDPSAYYLREVLPRKLAYYVEYAEQRSLLLDVKLIFQTVRAILRPPRAGG